MISMAGKLSCRSTAAKLSRKLVWSEGAWGSGLCFSNRLKVMDLGERIPRFILTAHPREDIGEQEILPRLVRLTGNGALLNVVRVLETILPYIQERDSIQ
jgi:hypothetical protein